MKCKTCGAHHSHWMESAVKKPGALRKELHAKEGKDIPEKKIERAEHSSNPLLAKRARLAVVFKKARGG